MYRQESIENDYEVSFLFLIYNKKNNIINFFP